MYTMYHELIYIRKIDNLIYNFKYETGHTGAHRPRRPRCQGGGNAQAPGTGALHGASLAEKRMAL